MFDVMPSGAVPNSDYWLHPEWYDRDRPMFRKYVPLVRDLAQAGWEPVTWAEANEPVLLNRFGHLDRGQLFLTVLNDAPTDRQLTITLEAKELGFTRQMPLVWEDVREQRLTARREGERVLVRVDVPGRDVAMIRLAPPAVMARARLKRIEEIIEARQTYAREIAKEAQLALWQPLPGGYVIDHTLSLHGAVSIRCEGGPKPAGAEQTALLYQDQPRPVIVSAHARFEGVSAAEPFVVRHAAKRSAVPETNKECAVELTLRSMEDQESRQTVSFQGEGEWLEARLEFLPDHPVKTIHVALTYRGQQGTVWFDEIAVREQGSDVNLLRCPGFEDGVLPPDLEQAVAGLLFVVRHAAKCRSGDGTPLRSVPDYKRGGGPSAHRHGAGAAGPPGEIARAGEVGSGRRPPAPRWEGYRTPPRPGDRAPHRGRPPGRGPRGRSGSGFDYPGPSEPGGPAVGGPTVYADGQRLPDEGHCGHRGARRTAGRPGDPHPCLGRWPVAWNPHRPAWGEERETRGTLCRSHENRPDL
jgi:hypothetical protein